MVFIMAGSMTAIMLAFMQGVYKSTSANLAVFVGAVLLWAGVGLVPSRVTVDGVDATGADAHPVPAFSDTPE